MSILRKPYEISLWTDVWNGEKFVEVKQFVFGSDTMEYQGRAIDPKLVRKTSGEVSFSFKMYYQFIDTITGEKVNNPFIAEIVNESKVKLKYNNKWFDLLVKNISKDSSGKSCTYQLTSQYVQELSKNGFDLTLDTQLMNNMGTVEELGRRVLENTDWGVQSEKVVQTQDETLVMLTVNSQIKAYKINDSNLIENGATIATSTTTIPRGAKIYAFYSSCSGDKPYYFQFIYKDASSFSEPYRGLFSTYSDRIVSDLGCQYVIDKREWKEEGDFVIPTDFIIDAGRENSEGIGNSSALSVLYRGKRYVYNQVTEYHAGLDMYLQKYKSNTNGKLYYKYTKTNFVTPNLIENIVTNTDFKQASGWNGVKFNDANPSTSVELVAATTTTNRNYHSAVWDVYTELGYSSTWVVSGLKKGNYCYIPNCTVSDEDKKPIYPIFEVLEDSVDNKTKLVSLGKTYGPNAPEIFEIDFSSSKYQPIIEPIYAKKNSVDFTSSTASMLNGDSPIGDSNYKPYLSCGKLFDFERANGNTALSRVIRNTGPKDKKSSFSGLAEGEKYKFNLSFYIIKHETEPATRLTAPYTIYTNANKTSVNFKIAQHNFDAKNLGYSVDSLTNKDINDKILFNASINATKGNSNAFSCSVELEALSGLTEEELKDANYQMFLEFPEIPQDSAASDNTGKTIKYYVWIEKIEFYKMIPKKSGGYYTPDDPIDSNNMEYNTEEKYFLVEDNQNKPLKELSFAPANMIFTPIFTSDCAKKSSINVKESNYFNAIQQLAETFNTWAAIEVNHDADGNLINFTDSTTGEDLGYSKRIYFKNYIGQENFAGFKYGINEKSIKRTLDSAQIVSKLIVKMNSNQYGPSGFCSISRASVNPQKDNVLYDFGYYANQGLLDADILQTDLYIMSAEDKTLLKNGLIRTAKIPKNMVPNFLKTSSGYYGKLSMINKALEELTSDQQDNRTPLNQEIADYNTYKALYDSATEGLVEAQNNFYAVAGYAYTQIPSDQVNAVYENTTLRSYLETISSLSSEQSTAEKKYKAAANNKKKYEEVLEKLKIKYDNALLFKEELYRLFYNRYSRFIQEGTWIDESYYDDNLYYNDAMSVLYNSSMPKVNYDISVISLAGIPGYELLDFKIGDQTFVEDIEFFGYDREGQPYREKITITETTENLDNPSKNSIKVQNYENQFQDLFQKITATVQSVQYTEGSYKKAEALANADIAHKIKFLSGAISDADTVLKNDGAQDWTLDENGLTLASRSTGSKLRAVGGAILLGEVGDDGKDKWITGLTANGISANLITAGSINTGTIQIMNGEEPTFRWDSHGITAYNFNNTSSDTMLSAIDKTKGVRFDRFGLYGYSGIDGEIWKPKSISGKNDGVASIDEKSTFSLTWEGLKVTNESGAVLKIGDNAKVDKNDKTIMKILDSEGQPRFNITENGNLFVKGDIEANSLKLSPTSTVEGLSYNSLADKPTVADLGLDVDKILYKGDVTSSIKTDDNGVQYTEVKVPTVSGDAITYSAYDSGDYLIFGRGQGTNVEGNKYTCISKDGLLTARNAWIQGTIYATNGEFNGTLSVGNDSNASYISNDSFYFSTTAYGATTYVWLRNTERALTISTGSPTDSTVGDGLLLDPMSIRSYNSDTNSSSFLMQKENGKWILNQISFKDNANNYINVRQLLSGLTTPIQNDNMTSLIYGQDLVASRAYKICDVTIDNITYALCINNTYVTLMREN